jgi:hypothetical protein
MQEKIQEAKKAGKLFGAFFLCCAMAAALGYYWYFTSYVRGILICAVLLSVLCIGSFMLSYYYRAKVKNLTNKSRK